MTTGGAYGHCKHAVSTLNAHLVFIAKYRRGVPDGEQDHVRLIVECPPEAPVSALAPPRSLRPPAAAGIHEARNRGTAAGISRVTLLAVISKRLPREDYAG
jgi:hypothetical protein